MGDESTTTRPSAVAYLCPAGPETRARWVPRIERWAEAEGLTLFEVYADANAGVPVEQRPSLVALIERATAEDAAAVLIPSADDLPGEDHWPDLQRLLEAAHLKVVILPEYFLR